MKRILILIAAIIVCSANSSLYAQKAQYELRIQSDSACGTTRFKCDTGLVPTALGLYGVVPVHNGGSGPWHAADTGRVLTSNGTQAPSWQVAPLAHVTQLSTAAIENMVATPPTILPAPASGTFNRVLDIVIKYNGGARGFNALSTDYPKAYYGSPSGFNIAAYNVIQSPTYFNGTAAKISFAFNPITSAQTGIDPSQLDGLPVILTHEGSDWAGGTTGAIDSTTLNSGGGQYAVGNIVTVDVGTGATIVVDSVTDDGNASVVTYHVTNNGTGGYSVGTGKTTTNTATNGGADGLDVSSGHGGTGYAVNDTFLISGGDGTAVGIVSEVDSGGAGPGVVTGVSANLEGGAYVPATNVSTTPGGDQPGIGTGLHVDILDVFPGNGLTVDINSLQPADGTATVTVLYYPITL